MRGYDLRDDLWSARLLLERPEAIRRLHRDYLEAGADCIICASYQATIEGLSRRGIGEAAAEDLLRLSVELGVEARDAFWTECGDRSKRLRPLVAASVGPYGAYLADGSEYTGAYGIDEDALVAFHRRRLEILAAGGADLLACETLPSRVEARALARLLEAAPGPPAWLSFSCRDSWRLNDGSDLAATVAELDDCRRIIAFGVNCTAPRHVPGLIARLRTATKRPIAVYPNSGEAWDASEKRWLDRGDCSDFGAASAGWRDAGARLIGGCCRTGPRDVREIRARLLGARPVSSASAVNLIRPARRGVR